MRDRMGREVEELVGTAYGGFVGRCYGKGVEKCESIFPEACNGRKRRLNRCGRSKGRCGGCWKEGTSMFQVTCMEIRIL